MNLISRVLPISTLLEELDLVPEHAWIYLRDDATVFDLDTEANIYSFDSRELSDDESDANEATLSEAGLGVSLSKQQLEDVISNARQRGVTSHKELIRFIDYYIFHDAFLPE